MKHCIFLGNAADLRPLCPIHLHLFFFPKTVKRLLKHLCCPDMRWHDDAVVHPLAFAPSLNNPRASEVSEVPRYLRLWSSQDLHKVADADLLVAHEVEKPKASAVSQRLKESFQVIGLFSHHVLCIRLDACDAKNIYSSMRI